MQLKHDGSSAMENRLKLFLASILAVLFILSYLIPEWYSATTNQLNFFNNAWDEANYLTHQMAVMQRYTPGYWFGANIYLLLEKTGLSGSWQNILFDTVLIPLTLISVVCISRKYFKVKSSEAIIIAIIICFSSVLFSYTNYAIASNFHNLFPNDLSFLIPSVITFPAILRSPNPQFSYFIIAATLLLYTRYQKHILLLLPLPFLYFPVFVSYLYLICAWYAYLRLSRLHSPTRIILANIVATFFVFFSLFMLTRLPFIHSMISLATLMNQSAYIGAFSHKFQLPLIFCIFLLGIPFFMLQKNKLRTDLLFLYFTVLMCILITANTQIVTGILFSPKNFQDYAATVLGGVLLAIIVYDTNDYFKSRAKNLTCVTIGIAFTAISFIWLVRLFSPRGTWGAYNNYLHIITSIGNKFGLVFVLVTILSFIVMLLKRVSIRHSLKSATVVTILIIVLSTQGFSIYDLAYTTYQYPKFTKKDLQILKQESPFVLIIAPDSNFYAQYLPYAIANLYSPLQSIHYTYPAFMKSCRYNLNYLDDAVTFIKRTPLTKSKTNLLNNLMRNIKANVLFKQTSSRVKRNNDLCKIAGEQTPTFSIITIYGHIEKKRLFLF